MPLFPVAGSRIHEHAARIGILDGWRGIAILLVLAGHFVGDGALHSGTLGVDFFFVLSGRLMAEILFIRREALPRFYLRRASRLYPAFAVFVLCLPLLGLVAPVHIGWLGILSALTFTINYASIYVHPTGVCDHLWSLCVEEHAYLLLGLLAWLCRRYGWPAFRIIFVLGMAALLNGIIQKDVLHRGYFAVFWRTDVQLAPVFLGAAAWLYAQKIGWRPLPALAPLCLGLALICKSSELAVISFGLGTVCLAATIACIETSPEPLQRCLRFAPLRQVGLWSYSIYLWQQPFYKMQADGHRFWPLPVAVICGLLSYYMVEQPLRRRLNRAFDASAAPAPALSSQHSYS